MGNCAQEGKNRGREGRRKVREEKTARPNERDDKGGRVPPGANRGGGESATRCQILRRWIIDSGFEAVPLIISRNLGMLSGI